MTDAAQGWVANAPMQVPSEAAGHATLVPSVGDATGSAGSDAAPSFENTGDPLLLIGRGSGRRAVKTTGLSLLIWTPFNSLVAGTWRTCVCHIVKRTYRCLLDDHSVLPVLHWESATLVYLICFISTFPLSAWCVLMRMLAHLFSVAIIIAFCR